MRPIYLALICGITGLGLGLSFPFLKEESQKPDKRSGLNGFINPVLECISRKGYGVKIFGIEERLNSFIENILQENPAIGDISVYFKDLNNGPEIGVNDNLPIHGGSLLKVPLMIGFFTLAEKDPEYLKQRISVKDQSLLKFYEVQGIKPESRIEVGKSYSIESLISKSIIESDNIAAVLLEGIDDNAPLKKVIAEMDISISSEIPPYREMNIRDYAGFFRILYNATYLNKFYSNYALEILSQTKFNGGLRKGISSNIIVSSKFGEKSHATKGLFLNECGIIYFPLKPYLLCISTRGGDKKQQMHTIADISRFIFDEVKNL